MSGSIERDRLGWQNLIDELREDMADTRTLWGDDADYPKVSEIRDIAARLRKACDAWEETAKAEQRERLNKV
jgi:hypothetical protein